MVVASFQNLVTCGLVELFYGGLTLFCLKINKFGESTLYLERYLKKMNKEKEKSCQTNNQRRKFGNSEKQMHQYSLPLLQHFIVSSEHSFSFSCGSPNN